MLEIPHICPNAFALSLAVGASLLLLSPDPYSSEVSNFNISSTFSVYFFFTVPRIYEHNSFTSNIMWYCIL